MVKGWVMRSQMEVLCIGNDEFFVEDSGLPMGVAAKVVCIWVHANINTRTEYSRNTRFLLSEKT